MQSLKSTFVAVLLFGLSVGLYQISDPPESSLDDQLVPAIDISDGSDLLVDDTTSLAVTQPLVQPHLQSQPLNLSASPSPKPPSLKQSPTDQPDPTFQVSPQRSAPNLAGGSTPKTRVPVPSLGNVQKFSYPETDQQTNFVSAGSVNEFRNRELIKNDRDQGLIDALQNQLQQPLSSNKVSDDFAANDGQFQSKSVTPDVSSPNQHHFVSTEPVSGTAQSIGASDSSVTQLAGSRMPTVGSDNNIQLAGSEPDLDSSPLNAAWTEVDRLVAETRYRDALKLLSRFYETDEINGPQRQRLLGWLDALAGKVIFSAEHHFRKQPHIVAADESLVDLAQRWQVPAQLIYNINRSEIPNPTSIAPGTSLKVVDRPFDAKLDLNNNVMTLFTDGLYAGRYPVRIGVSGNVTPGDYRVLAKAAEGFRWRDASGTEYPPESPLNGYGPHWIGLSGSLCLHALKPGATEGHHGCIGLNPTDAADVFQILSPASTVTIAD